MLTEMMVRLGKAVRDSDWGLGERIQLLTDVGSENCKNFFQNVHIVEVDDGKVGLLSRQIGHFEDKDKFKVDTRQNIAFPIVYPNGGNPVHAQGVYPIPCYLLYDPHMKSIANAQNFAGQYVQPRLNSTVVYSEASQEQKERLAGQVAEALQRRAESVIQEDKQLGILVIADASLGLFSYRDAQSANSHTTASSSDHWLYMGESALYPGKLLYVNGAEALRHIVEAKFSEAATLGMERDAVSTFTNEQSEMVVSVYNKSWLWMSPTWDMPKPLYWKDTDWTKGIKLDRGSYEAFLYGTQSLKKITVPVHSAILKEMFAQIMNAEAKSHMRATSFNQVFGAPFVLPLLDRSYEQTFFMLLELMKDRRETTDSELHLEVLQGLEESLDVVGIVSGLGKQVNIPEATQDLFRLTILYYSGDLSRGNMHVRAVVEDVVPSVARGIAAIINKLYRIEYREIQQFVGLNPDKASPYEVNRINTLPALLGNAYGPGYLWSTLQRTLHRQPLTLERVARGTAIRLNEMANKRNTWGMRQELAFYYSFISFFKAYAELAQHQMKGVNGLSEWQALAGRYYGGELAEEELHTSEQLGFISGMLLRQFENSYRVKTGKEFVEHRVMRFGSKLTPDMIWRDGVLRCAELEKQWRMNLGKSYYVALPIVLQGFSYANKNNLLIAEPHLFINGFWSGYLTYKNPKSDKRSGSQEEEQAHVHSQQ